VSADKTPLDDAVEQALDAFVYAPIGLLFDGPASFSRLVRNGRSQVTNARMMGQFAVQMGRTEVNKRAAELDGPMLDLLRGLGLVPGATPTPARTEPATPTQPRPATPKTATTKTTTKPAGSKVSTKKAGKKAAAKKTAARKAPVKAAPSPGGLPIPDYDSLSASQVVSRLRGLSTSELEAVRAYEAATRNRKTILNKVQQLRKP
jgi:hypothetical protein